MKRLILVLSVAVVLSALCGATWVSAKDVPETPPGLADRGPLTKLTFIHYRKEPVRSPAASRPKVSPCYGFLASGAKWKTTENYLVNPSDSGLGEAFVDQTVASGVAEWEEYGGSSIFGTGTRDLTALYDDTLTDGKNVVAFGANLDSSVIAVTNVWGYFYGPPKTRELLEWDMLLNTHFVWGDAAADPSLMDLQNIVTHELGHSAGMADLYTGACSLETMYGYSLEGETIKRDLNTGDIRGIQTLY